MKLKKKAQAENSVSSIITLIVGVAVATLVLIFVGSLGGQTYNLVEPDIDVIGNNVVTGDIFTLLNDTEVSLAHRFIQEGTLSIYNNSNTVEYGLGNFTINYDAGTIQNAGHEALNNTELGANYTWGASEIRLSVKNSVISGFSSLETTGSYIPIIVLAVVIFLVLGLVLGFANFGGNKGNSGQAL